MISIFLALTTFLNNPQFFEPNVVSAQVNCFDDNIIIQQTKKKKALFEQHFKNLDSVVKANPNDTTYRCCYQSILFMVKNTKIEVSTDGTTLGRVSFNKSDWLQWHAWYKKRYAIKKG